MTISGGKEEGKGLDSCCHDPGGLGEGGKGEEWGCGGGEKKGKNGGVQGKGEWG